MIVPVPSHYQSGVTFSGFGCQPATAFLTHPLPATTLTNRTMSDPNNPSDGDRKQAGKKRAPPAAAVGAVGTVTPPRAVVVPNTGVGSAGNPILVSSVDREEVTVRRGRRALLRGDDRPTTTPPVASVPAFLAPPPGEDVPPVLSAPSAAAAAPPGAAIPGNFLTLFNHNGFFSGGLTTGFKTRREAGVALMDTTLITVNDYNRLANNEVAQVNTNVASDAPLSDAADDIASRIFPDPLTTPRGNPIRFLREFATKFYMTPVPWDASLQMGDLLVYVFVMLNFLRDGLDMRNQFKVPKVLGKDTRFVVTYSNIVETLGPLFSSAMVYGPDNVHLCDHCFRTYHKRNGREFRNPDFLFLVIPIFKMVKAFFPGKASNWNHSLSRTGNTLTKAQSEKIVNHGLYSNALLEKFSIPGGTRSVPHDTLLSGMLFEYALILAYVNPVFCGDANIFRRVLAKGRRGPAEHYYLLPGELDMYRDPVGLVIYYSGDGIFFYTARSLQTRGP